MTDPTRTAHRSVAAAVLLVLGSGCGGGRSRMIDLVDRYPLAEVHREIHRIDFGHPAARAHLARGWYQDEGPTDDGTTFVWSRGGASELEFFLVRPRPMEVRLRCRPIQIPGDQTQGVTPHLNGVALDEIVLGPGFREYELALPREPQLTGLNRLEFRYRHSRSPREAGSGGDWRRLAVAFDWVVLGGESGADAGHPSAATDALLLPPGSEIAYYLRFAPQMELRIASVDPIGAARPVLRIAVVTDRDGETMLAELRAGDGGVRRTIQGPTGEPFRLVLRTETETPNGGAGGLRVERPHLVAVPMVDVRYGRSKRARDTDRPNVIIYLVDALRADRLSAYGHSRPTSPGLDEFARTATLYDQAYAQSSWTRPAVASLFTGLRPEVHGANRRRDRLPRGPATMAERLSGAGYQTAAVVANPNVAAEFGFDRGFDHYEMSPVAGRRSIDLNRRVVEWLDRRRTDLPFFLYVHTVDPHLPYDPPPEFRSRFAAGVEGDDLGSTESVGALLARDLEAEVEHSRNLLDLYDAEVASNDHSFAALLRELDRRGLVAGSMIVFLSDHGEEFFDHGGWIHGRTLYREMLRIPLVISYPGQSEGHRERTPVQHVDLFPTVLDVAGVEVGSSVHGWSLLGEVPGGRAISAFLDHDGWRGLGVVRGRWKAIRHGHGGFLGRPELYEVENDPHELEDRGQELEVLAGTLLSESREEVVGEEGLYEAEAAEIDEELRERLKALGYI